MHGETRTPWLALIDVPNPGKILRDQEKLTRWSLENTDEHPERHALVHSLNASLDRARRELETACWILDQAINFKPMEGSDAR